MESAGLKKRNTKHSNNISINLSGHQRKLRYLRLKRRLRKWQIALARSRVLVRILGVLLLAWAIMKLSTLQAWYLSENIFKAYPNSSLQIEGNQIVSEQQIVKELQDINLPDKPLYLLDTKPIKERLKSLAPVKKVFIRRYWAPARLKIVIDEKIPLIGIKPKPKANYIAVFTNDASIIDKKYLPLNYKGRIITLLTYADYKKWTSKHIRLIYIIARSLELYSSQRLLYLDTRDYDDCYAQLKHIKLRLGPIDSKTTKKIEQLTPEVIEQAMEIKNEVEYVDLRWDDSLAIKIKDKNKKKKKK